MSVLKKWKVAFAAFAVLLAVLFGAAFSAVSASAEELDQLKTDFRTGSAGWQLNSFAAVSSEGLSLIPGGEAQTEGSFGAVLLYVSLGNVSGGFTLRLGEGSGAGCTLEFQNRLLTVTGLTDAGEPERVLMERAAGTGSFLKIETIGSSLNVYLKNENEPYDYLGDPVAELQYAGNGAPAEGNIVLTVPQGSSAVVEAVSAFSLRGAIHIETENAPEETEEPDVTQPEEGGLEGWQIALIAVACVIVAGGVVAFVLLHRKKSKKGESGDEKDR